MNKNNTAAAKSEPTKIWNASFISIFIASSALYLGLNMINALITKYANTMTDSSTMVGLVSSVFAVSALVLKIVSGPVTDTFNKKYVIFGASLLMGVSFFGYGFSDSIEALIGFRLVQGTAQTFTAIALLALASECLPKKNLTTGIGVFTLAQTACQAISPALGLKLVETIGYSYTFMMGGAFLVLAAVLTLRVDVPYRRTKKLRITLQGIIAKEAIVPAIIMGLVVMAYSVVNSFLIIYAEDQGVTANIGYFFTVNACVMLISRPVISRMTDRFGLVKVIIPALVVFAGSFVIVSASTSLWMFLLAGILMGCSYGACQPLVQSLCIKCVSPERRGAASNTNYVGFDLGNMLGPIAAGAVAEKFGYGVTWLTAIVPVAVAVIVVIVFSGKIARVEKEFEKRQ